MKFLLIAISFLTALAVNAKNATDPKTDRKPASIVNELIEAHLNIADTLARARVAGLTCDTNAYQSTILSSLDSAQNLDGFSPSKVSANIRQALAGTIRLKEILGEVNFQGSKTPLATYQKALVDTYFEGSGSGVYGPAEKFYFRSNGVIEMETLQILEQEPWQKYIASKGTWGVNIEPGQYDELVRVWFKIGNKTRVLRLERSYEGGNGWLLRRKELKSSPGSEYNSIKFQNGIVSECDA